jgi:hypothetical protein
MKEEVGQRSWHNKESNEYEASRRKKVNESQQIPKTFHANWWVTENDNFLHRVWFATNQTRSLLPAVRGENPVAARTNKAAWPNEHRGGKKRT